MFGLNVIIFGEWHPIGSRCFVMIGSRCIGLLMGVLVLCFGKALPAAPVRVAVASSLQPAMVEIIQRFEQEQGAKGLVLASFGSSGKMATQVIQGAPFHLLITADLDSCNRVVMSGKVRGPQVHCAVGHLVLVAKGPDSMGFALDRILDPSIERIALPNPEVAPNGRLAMAILKDAGMLDSVRPKLVMTQNVGQATQYFLSGVVDAAWMGQSALNEVLGNMEVTVLRFPEGAIDQIVHPMVRLTHGTPGELESADQFFNYMLSETSRDILEAYGYHHPATF